MVEHHHEKSSSVGSPGMADLSNDHDRQGLNFDLPKTGNKAVNLVTSLSSIFDGPATFFREKILNKTRKDYPYYHRQFKRVPEIDECAYNDHVCIFEANEQYLRDKKVDKFITQILGERVEECYAREGVFDGSVKCRKLDDAYETALTNYFIKYGDLSSKHNCIDAYMKQKHRLIWERRNPEKDLYGHAKLKENREKVAAYQKKLTDDPLQG